MLYDSENDLFGLAYRDTHYTWSDTANQRIITSDMIGYCFFEFGRPWGATYYYSNRHVSYDTLEEKKSEATFQITKDAFGEKYHQFYGSVSYLSNINIIKDDYGNLATTSKKNLYFWPDKAFTALRDRCVVQKLPYLF